MLKKILIGLLAVVLVLGVLVALQPSEYHVERSKKIKASPDIVWNHVADFGKWDAWSPWAKQDPTQKITLSGTAGQVGHASSWKGEKTGVGTMTIGEASKPSKLRIDMAFKEPMNSTAVAAFTLKPEKDEVTVTWSLDGKNDFVGKAFSMVMNMDEMIGGQYEKGLASLGTLAEAEAEKQAEEEAKRAAAAQAAADAAAAEPAAAEVQ